MTVWAKSRAGGARRQTLRIVQLLVSRWIIVVLCVLIGVLAAAYDIRKTQKSYSASAQLFVTVASVADASQLYTGDQFTQSRVQSYVSVVTSPDVVDPVRRELHLSMNDGKLAGDISADAPLNKVLINIHASNKSAQLAAEIANAIAQQFTVVVQRIETVQRTAGGAPSSPLKLSIIHQASVPSAPVAPRKTLMLAVGLLGGLLLGMLLVVARERLFRRIRSPQEVEAIASSPPLGVVPRDRQASKRPNAFRSPDTARAEAFRQLRTNLQFVDIDDPPKIIAVSSPLGTEGKTSVALNLAIALAEAGVSVVLVDADLRQPSLAAELKLDDHAGLTSVLIGAASVDDAIQYVSGGLAVVTSGPIPFNPSELLASRQARTAVGEIARRFEYTIIDSAAMLPIADGSEVAAMADATVLVVRAGKTNPESIRRSLNTVTRVGGTVAGVVLNRASYVSGWIPAAPSGSGGDTRQATVARERLSADRGEHAAESARGRRRATHRPTDDADGSGDSTAATTRSAGVMQPTWTLRLPDDTDEAEPPRRPATKPAEPATDLDAGDSDDVRDAGEPPAERAPESEPASPSNRSRRRRRERSGRPTDSDAGGSHGEDPDSD